MRDIREVLEYQLSTPKITKDKIRTLRQKEYHSGRKIKVDDKVLFGFLVSGEDPDTGEFDADMICFEESEIDEYVKKYKVEETDPETIVRRLSFPLFIPPELVADEDSE